MSPSAAHCTDRHSPRRALRRVKLGRRQRRLVIGALGGVAVLAVLAGATTGPAAVPAPRDIGRARSSAAAPPLDLAQLALDTAYRDDDGANAPVNWKWSVYFLGLEAVRAATARAE